jgi:GMP reductase
MKIDNDVKLDFSDVLIRPKRSNLDSRNKVDLKRTFVFKLSETTASTWNGVPIVAANMDTVGTFEMAEGLGKSHGLCAIHKYYDESTWDTNLNHHAQENCNIIYTLGMGSDDTNLHEIEKAQRILNNHKDIRFICLDVANGYTEKFVKYVSHIRNTFPDHIIIAGNVVTSEMTEELILAGANIVKIGIGPGSVCTTRKVAGVGFPQLSAIMECADAAHGLGGYVMADGGCTCPGDIAKAFGGGADFVMIGGMFAGTDEAAGEETEEGKAFYGMSSRDAMHKYSGGVASYRATEGKKVFVESVGSVTLVMQQILGGLRSACTYVGAARLKDLSKCTTFIRVNNQINNIFK